MTAILALDLATKCGFALWQPPGTVLSGTWNFQPSRFDGGGVRYLRFRHKLDEMHAATPVSRVVFEEVLRHAGTTAAHTYAGFLATLQTWCEERGIPYEGVGVGTIKRHWTGKGNAGKEQMVAEAVRRGYQVGDDNEADALAILDWLLVNEIGDLS